MLLSDCAAKFTLMPVFAVKLTKTCFRSNPDQPMKLSSPEVANASRTIQGAAIAAAAVFRTMRRVVLGMVLAARARESTRAGHGSEINERGSALEAAPPDSGAYQAPSSTSTSAGVKLTVTGAPRSGGAALGSLNVSSAIALSCTRTLIRTTEP